MPSRCSESLLRVVFESPLPSRFRVAAPSCCRVAAPTRQRLGSNSAATWQGGQDGGPVAAGSSCPPALSGAWDGRINAVKVSSMVKQCPFVAQGSCARSSGTHSRRDSPSRVRVASASSPRRRSDGGPPGPWNGPDPQGPQFRTDPQSDANSDPGRGPISSSGLDPIAAPAPVTVHRVRVSNRTRIPSRPIAPRRLTRQPKIGGSGPSQQRDSDRSSAITELKASRQYRKSTAPTRARRAAAPAQHEASTRRRGRTRAAGALLRLHSANAVLGLSARALIAVSGVRSRRTRPARPRLVETGAGLWQPPGPLPRSRGRGR